MTVFGKKNAKKQWSYILFSEIQLVVFSPLKVLRSLANDRSPSLTPTQKLHFKSWDPEKNQSEEFQRNSQDCCLHSNVSRRIATGQVKIIMLITSVQWHNHMEPHQLLRWPSTRQSTSCRVAEDKTFVCVITNMPEFMMLQVPCVSGGRRWVLRWWVAPSQTVAPRVCRNAPALKRRDKTALLLLMRHHFWF